MQSRILDMTYYPRFLVSRIFPLYPEYSRILDISLPAALSIRGYEMLYPLYFRITIAKLVLNDGTDWALVMLL